MQLEVGSSLYFNHRLNEVILKTVNTSLTLPSHSSDYNDDDYQLSIILGDHHQAPL